MGSRERGGPFKVDVEVSAGIQKYFQRHYEPDRSFLDGRVLGHEPPKISEEERARRTRWAYTALLRDHDWEGTLVQIKSVLENLGQEAYAHIDYTQIDSHKLIAYFDKVTKEIGAETLFYCPDVAFDIMAKNREAKSQRS